jgi:hypothetical protein
MMSKILEERPMPEAISFTETDPSDGTSFL